MRAPAADGSCRRRTIACNEHQSFAMLRRHVRALQESVHGLARSKGSGHRWGGFPRLQSLPHAGGAGRARDGARWLPVRQRRERGEPGRCRCRTGARRHPRDRPALAVRGRRCDLQPGCADQPHGRPERSAGGYRGECRRTGAADPGGARGGTRCGRGARLDAAVLRAGGETAGGREPAGGAARRQRRVEVRRRAGTGCWSTACGGGRWCRCG